VDIENRYESEKIGKKLWQRQHSQPVSRSFSFPRYTTSLATNAMRSPDPCSSHTPHGTRHTHVSDHRRPSSSSLDLPDLANSAALPFAHHISIDLLALPCPHKVKARRRTGPALRSDLYHATRPNFRFVPPTTTSLLRRASNTDGLVRATTGDQHRMQPLQLPNGPLKAILTASTWLFAAPRKASQFRTA
jgi:hypothetical protein